jgi:hypothetical protein
MIAILITIAVLLFIIIIHVSIVSYNDKKAFEKSIDVSEDVIQQK